MATSERVTFLPVSVSFFENVEYLWLKLKTLIIMSEVPERSPVFLKGFAPPSFSCPLSTANARLAAAAVPKSTCPERAPRFDASDSPRLSGYLFLCHTAGGGHRWPGDRGRSPAHVTIKQSMACEVSAQRRPALTPRRTQRCVPAPGGALFCSAGLAEGRKPP